MTLHPQLKYIIEEADVEIIEMAFPKSSFVRHLRSRPHIPAPAALDSPKKRWEDCRQHFTCPNGEECWYLSEDYHNEEKATICNQTLDKIIPTLGRAIQTDISDNDYVMIEDLESVIESLRSTPSTQEHERGDQR